MNFAFGQNEEPLDLSKGGDKGSGQGRPSLPTPGAGTSVPPPPAKFGTGNPAVRPSLPQPPARVAHPQQPAAPQRPVAPQQPQQPQQGYQYPAAPVQPQYNEPQPQQGYQYPAAQPEPQYYPEEQYSQPVQPVQPQKQARTSGGPLRGPNRGPAGRPAPQAPVETDKKGRPKKTKAAKKTNPYGGSRRNVLFARIGVFGILGLLMLFGVNSLLPKSSGLRPGDGPLIIEKVRENLGITDFPTATGEGIALGFSKTYLTYSLDSEARDARVEALLGYAPESVIESIDPRVASAEQIAAANAVVPSVDGEEQPTEAPGDVDAADPAQVSTSAGGETKVTDGPYIVKREMVAGGENAIFTTKTQVNGSTWIYMSIPMTYNPDFEEGGISISGSPTFVAPTSVAPVPAGNYETGWTADASVQEVIEPDIEIYMRAWASSDVASLERLTVRENGKLVATEAARTGLHGSVAFLEVEDLIVQSKPEPADGASNEEMLDFYTRDARVTVSWIEPSSGLVYTQTYQLELRYVNSDWFVQDIQNVATSAGPVKERL